MNCLMRQNRSLAWLNRLSGLLTDWTLYNTGWPNHWCFTGIHLNYNFLVLCFNCLSLMIQKLRSIKQLHIVSPKIIYFKFQGSSILVESRFRGKSITKLYVCESKIGHHQGRIASESSNSVTATSATKNVRTQNQTASATVV